MCSRGQVPEGSQKFQCVLMWLRLGEFRHLLVYVAEASSGRFWRVPESSAVRWCRYRRQGSEGSEELRCGLLLCNLDRSSHVIVLNTFW